MHVRRTSLAVVVLGEAARKETAQNQAPQDTAASPTALVSLGGDCKHGLRIAPHRSPQPEAAWHQLLPTPPPPHVGKA